MSSRHRSISCTNKTSPASAGHARPARRRMKKQGLCIPTIDDARSLSLLYARDIFDRLSLKHAQILWNCRVSQHRNKRPRTTSVDGLATARGCDARRRDPSRALSTPCSRIVGERIRLTASGAAKPAIRAKVSRHLGTFAFTRALLFRALKFVKSKGGNDETRFDRCR